MADPRCGENPIVTPTMVHPSQADLEVIGVFNPAVVEIGNETLLLLRVAEAPRDVPPGEVAAPVYDVDSKRIEIRRWARGKPGLDTSDPRVIRFPDETHITSISHLRRARSRDGLRFEVESEPALAPADRLESFGIEDPRAVFIDGWFHINYSAVSPWGIATAAVRSRDLKTFERCGILFAPPNRDVTLFPERLGGHYLALHRPMPEGVGRPAIWLASSPDLRFWGEHRLVAAPRPGSWDDLKLGGGAPPFRVSVDGRHAWLAIYHGVSSEQTYSLGALLLDEAGPGRVLGRSREPILAPEAPYEREGFFGNVVFTCGVVRRGDLVRIYYGAADTVVAVADLSLDAILAGLE